MNNHPNDREFLKFLDEEMAREKERRFREHVEGCEQCSDRLEQLRTDEDQLAEEIENAPGFTSVKQDVMDEIGNPEAEGNTIFDGEWIRTAANSRSLQVAASLLLMIGVGAIGYYQFLGEPVREFEQAELKVADDAGTESTPAKPKRRASPSESEEPAEYLAESKTFSGRTGKEHFQLALNLQDSQVDTPEKGSMGPPQSEDSRGRSVRREKEPRSLKRALRQQNVASAEEKEQSVSNLEQANEQFRKARQKASGNRGLASRATIHIARNLFRLDQPEKAVAEYEAWKQQYGDTDVLSRQDREVQAEVEKRYQTYRLRQKGWIPTGEGIWKLSEDGVIVAEPGTQARPIHKRVLVFEETPSDTGFELEASVKRTGERSGGGLAFGLKGRPEQGDIDEFYAYGYFPATQRESVIYFNSGENEQTTVWSRARSLPTDDWFDLRIAVNGNKVSLYFNGEPSTTLEMDQPYRDKIGLIVQGEGAVEFKNSLEGVTVQ